MRDLEDAKTGEEVELLVEGEWILAEWSDHAWDGSPTGTTAFANLEDAHLMIPDEMVEDWRPGNWTTYTFIDALSDPMAKAYVSKCVSVGIPLENAINGYSQGISYEYLAGVSLPL